MNPTGANEGTGLGRVAQRASQNTPAKPVRDSFQGEAARAGDDFTPESPAPLTQGTRCLIVDDVAAQRLILLTIVRSLGVDADVAVDGAQAVAMARQQRYDLIFMDVSMPSMDGLTATRLIRVHEAFMGRSATPIFIVTSHDSYVEIQGASAAGADGHIPKPVMVQTIVKALMSVIRRRGG